VSVKRKIAVWSLIGIATLLLLISTMTIWTKRQLLNTDNWTRTSGQLLANDTVRAALSTKLVDLLFQKVDVAQQLKSRLPPQLAGLAPVAAGALENAGPRAVNALLQTNAAQTLWERSNRRMHRELVNVLEGKPLPGHVTTAGGQVTLNLRPMLLRVADRLGVSEQLNARAGPNAGKIVILKASQLKAAQTGVQALKALTIFLVIVVLALYALAIYLARGSRRTTLEVIGGCIFLVGLLLLIAQRLLGDAIVNAVVKTDASRPAGHEIWMIATSVLRDVAIALVVYGLLTVLAGVLAGPSRVAVGVRRRLAPAFRRHVVVVYAVVVTILLILVAWAPLGRDRQLLGTLVLFILILCGVEVYRRQTLREFPETGVAPAQPPPEVRPPEAPAGRKPA
jgi:hypothetical protein